MLYGAHIPPIGTYCAHGVRLVRLTEADKSRNVWFADCNETRVGPRRLSRNCLMATFALTGHLKEKGNTQIAMRK